MREQRLSGYDGEVDVVGECFDLGSACKQCPFADEHDTVNILAIENPCNECRMLFNRIYALFFGARRSVVQFNRVASGIKQLLVRRLLLPGLNYDGDCPLNHQDRLKVRGSGYEGGGRADGVKVEGRSQSKCPRSQARRSFEAVKLVSQERFSERMCELIGVFDVPKFSSQKSDEAVTIVPQERISERMWEQDGVVELPMISSQKSVEVVNCFSGANF